MTEGVRHPLASEAEAAFLAGVGNVDPTKLVKAAVRQGLLDDWLGDLEHPEWMTVVALGKAAPRMVWGLVEAGVPVRGIGVAPRGVRAPQIDTFRWLPGDHPVPGDDSFAAGSALLAWLGDQPSDLPVLALLSGGASACVEVPGAGVDRGDLVAKWQALLGQGVGIDVMNRERSSWSAIKGGRLARRILEKTNRLRCWLLADTPAGLEPETVGSAPFWLEDGSVEHTILAGNDQLVQQAGLHLGSMGWNVYRHADRIAGDVVGEVESFLSAFHDLDGEGQVALVGGGEPTVALPAAYPVGGRCRHAALVAARWLSEHGSDAVFLAGTSDGVDGVPGASGAWADRATWDLDPEGAVRALQDFDAVRFLEAGGRTFDLGHTGTNVNDLWVALRSL